MELAELHEPRADLVSRCSLRWGNRENLGHNSIAYDPAKEAQGALGSQPRREVGGVLACCACGEERTSVIGPHPAPPAAPQDRAAKRQACLTSSQKPAGTPHASCGTLEHSQRRVSNLRAN